MALRNFGVALRDMMESLGPRGTHESIKQMLKKKEIKPENFSLAELAEACETARMRNVTESVSSDLFPIITGSIISQKIMDSYSSAATIGDQLTTTVPSKVKVEQIPGFTAVDNVENVLEGQSYNDSSFEEKYSTVTHLKFGRILSITEEAVFYDQTNKILAHAATIGEKAALYREQLIMRGIMDLDGTVYQPKGVAEALYSAVRSTGIYSIPNLATSNPFGEAGLLAAGKLLHNMRDEQGNFVLIDTSNLICLTAYDRYIAGLQMINSTQVPEGSENASNIFKGAFKVLTSPFLTEQSASTWFYGDFKRQFRWSENWPLMVFTAKPGNEDEFKKDVKAQYKVRFLGNVGCSDTLFVIKSIA